METPYDLEPLLNALLFSPFVLGAIIVLVLMVLVAMIHFNSKD